MSQSIEDLIYDVEWSDAYNCLLELPGKQDVKHHIINMPNGDDEFQGHITLEPPAEKLEADSDADSDWEDGQFNGLSILLPKKMMSDIMLTVDESQLLKKKCLMSKRIYSWQDRREKVLQRGDGDMVVKHTFPSIWHPHKPIAWGGQIFGKMDLIPKFKTVPYELYPKLKKKIKTSLDCINLYWTPEWIGELCFQSKAYAIQKVLPCLHVTPDNMRVFLAILLHSGLNFVRNRSVYWEEATKQKYPLIAKSMSQVAFDQIMNCFHLADNYTLGMEQDRFYKVRPAFDHLNAVNHKLCKTEQFYTVDEMMVPYHSWANVLQMQNSKRLQTLKTYYKLWAMCTSTGFLLHVVPHRRIDSSPLHNKKHGSPEKSVVLYLVDVAGLKKGQSVVFKSRFASVQLLQALLDRGIGATCLLEDEHIANFPPLAPRSLLEKQIVGDHSQEYFTYGGNVSVIRWTNDKRKSLNVASNKFYSEPMYDINQDPWLMHASDTNFEPQENSEEHYIIPHSLEVYNNHIRGVEAFSVNMRKKGTVIRSNKWWFPLFFTTVSCQFTNAHYLYRETLNLENRDGQSTFTDDVINEILKKHGATSRNWKAPEPIPPKDCSEFYYPNRPWN